MPATLKLTHEAIGVEVRRGTCSNSDRKACSRLPTSFKLRGACSTGFALLNS